MANASLKQKCLAIVRGMDSKQANVREHLIHKKVPKTNYVFGDLCHTAGAVRRIRLAWAYILLLSRL